MRSTLQKYYWKQILKTRTHTFKNTLAQEILGNMQFHGTVWMVTVDSLAQWWRVVNSAEITCRLVVGWTFVRLESTKCPSLYLVDMVDVSPTSNHMTPATSTGGWCAVHIAILTRVLSTNGPGTTSDSPRLNWCLLTRAEKVDGRSWDSQFAFSCQRGRDAPA